MEPFRTLPPPEVLRDSWTEFVRTGTIPSSIDPLVLLSWQRCAPKLNAHTPPRWKQLRGQMLDTALAHSALLRTVAQPIMEDVYQFTEGAGTALLLLDTTLLLLDLIGHPYLTIALQQVGIEKGVYLTEGYMGTNAFSIAQLERTPAWVFGPEHYLNAFHEFSSSAAPIHNPDGSLVGVIGLVEPCESSSIQSLGIATSAARAIESQLQIDLLRQEAELRTVEINHIIDAISDGLLVWDGKGRVIFVNLRGSTILGVRQSHLMGRELRSFVELPEILQTAVKNAESLTDVECSLMIGSAPIMMVVNLHNIIAAGMPLYVLTFRLTEEVRGLVSRQVGAQARQTVENLVGESAAARNIRRQVLAAAKATAPILIEGESGTGKATAARAIHNSSARRDDPFLAMHCRAIPRELVLAEFLGFEPGAYTNINQGGQPSKFELVHGGTLFLDEIDALPLEMQAALFQVLESESVLRLGAKYAVPIDVRIIASTTMNLEAAIADGSFRGDLYYRLRSFHIKILPLRERPEDIPTLITEKLDLLSHQMGRTMHLSSDVQETLCNYSWPGNIRELESTLERAVVISEGDMIEFLHLPRSVHEAARVSSATMHEPVLSLEQAERNAIVAAARAAHGNLSKTAAMLGIGRTTLWRKLVTMNLNSEDFK
jgi:transcriptional regulator of acetoin/glycerol metabolism